MGISNFDGIKANYYVGLPESGSDGDSQNTGAVFYVNNATTGLLSGAIGGSNGNNGTSPLTPFATLDYAIGQCSANRGDTIYLLPGHAENVAAATALTIAGVRYIGLGVGDARPTITFTTANTAPYSSAVANLYFENIVFVANFLSIAAAFTLSTAKGVTFGLNNVQIIGDGPRLDGAKSVEDEFSADTTLTPADLATLEG